MTEKITNDAANKNKAINPQPDMSSMTGLYEEMQALMAVMPVAGFDTGQPLSTEEEIEAMFDNMPV